VLSVKDTLLSLEAKDLLQFLAVRHPYWTKQKGWWIYTQALKTQDCDIAELLVRGASEHIEEFTQRCNLTKWVPETPCVVDRIIGFLSRNDCSRERMDDELKLFVEKADNRRRGTLKDVELSALENALYTGTYFVLIDRKSLPIGNDGKPIKATSKADEEALLESPYCVLYSPLNVVNWKMGADGFLEWVMIREETIVQANVIDQKEQHTVYRYFDRNEWAKITIKPKKQSDSNKDKSVTLTIVDEKDSNKVVIDIDGEEHKLGMVPLVCVAPCQDSDSIPLTGESFVKPGANLDYMIVNLESDYNFDRWIHLHPKLIVKSKEPDLIVLMKSTSAIKLNPDEKEDASYISPDSEIFKIASEDIQRMRESIWTLCKQEAANRITNGRQIKEQSGVHKRLSFEMSEGTVLSDLSDDIVSTDKAILEIANRYIRAGVNPGPQEQTLRVEVTRRKNYDIFWIREYLETVKDSKDILSKSPRLMLEIIHRVARAILDSPAEETLDVIRDELIDTKSLKTESVSALLEIAEQLKAIEFPSEELIKRLYITIAMGLIEVDDLTGNKEANGNQEILDTIIDQIQESDITLTNGDDFESRGNEEANAE
jgi:hypothetical protein